MQRYGFASAPISNGGYRYYFIIYTIHDISFFHNTKTHIYRESTGVHASTFCRCFKNCGRGTAR